MRKEGPFSICLLTMNPATRHAEWTEESVGKDAFAERGMRCGRVRAVRVVAVRVGAVTNPNCNPTATLSALVSQPIERYMQHPNR
jgi:hypothetical protein